MNLMNGVNGVISRVKVIHLKDFPTESITFRLEGRKRPLDAVP